MNLPAFDPLLETAFHSALQASLAASVLAFLVLLVVLVFHKNLPPRWRYALWLLVMLRLLVPMTPSSSLSLFNLKNRALPVQAEALPHHMPAAPPLALASQPERVPEMALAWTPPPSPIPPADGPKAASRPRLGAAARYLWLAGAAGYLLLVLLQHRRLSNWVKGQPALSTTRLTALVKEAQAMLRLAGDIPVIRVEGQGSPAVFRLRRPCLLLPGAVIDSLEDRELLLVILHELVHVRRRDVLLNWIAIVAQSLHWFNPVVWLVLKRWRGDRELVCDAEVMARLSPPQRHTYGFTLLKLAATFSEPLFARSVTPIIEHKHEIERRIIMIAKYKPMSHIAAAALVLSLAGLGALTFTRAAEQAPAAKLVPQPEKEAASDNQVKAGQAGVAYMEQELAKLNTVLKRKQDELNGIKQHLQMTEIEAAGATMLEPETLRKMEASRIEAGAQYQQVETVYKSFKQIPRHQLKQAILVDYPDAQLARLLDNESSAEQKLADLLVTYSLEHPEVQRVSRILQTVTNQVQTRLDGFLAGLKAKLDSRRAEADALQRSIAEAKESNIKRAVETRPYFEAKRDLESLTNLRDRLQVQLIAEKINARIPLNL